MPAKSKVQQRLMGMAYSLKKGEMDPKDASQEVKDLAASMSIEDLKDFAETKHKGLPDEIEENVTPANIGGMGNLAFPQGGEVGSGDVPAGRGDAKKEQKKKKKEREEYLKNRKEESMFHTTFSGFINEAKIKDARKDLGYVAFLEEMAEINSRDIQNAYDAAIEVLQDKDMSEKEAIGFLNSPHGKYMAEYLIPGQDYSHEAFLDKLDEYYNERMLKQYAKDFKNLA